MNRDSHNINKIYESFLPGEEVDRPGYVVIIFEDPENDEKTKEKAFNGRVIRKGKYFGKNSEFDWTEYWIFEFDGENPLPEDEDLKIQDASFMDYPRGHMGGHGDKYAFSAYIKRIKGNRGLVTQKAGWDT